MIAGAENGKGEELTKLLTDGVGRLMGCTPDAACVVMQVSLPHGFGVVVPILEGASRCEAAERGVRACDGLNELSLDADNHPDGGKDVGRIGERRGPVALSARARGVCGGEGALEAHSEDEVVFCSALDVGGKTCRALG